MEDNSSTHLSLLNGESIFIRNFKCNSDLIKKLYSLPSFYKELVSYWSEASYSTMNNVEILLTESLWYNTNVKINNSTVLYKEFALAGINQVCHLFDKFGKLIKFNDLVDKLVYHLLSFLNGCSSLMHYQLTGNKP